MRTGRSSVACDVLDRDGMLPLLPLARAARAAHDGQGGSPIPPPRSFLRLVLVFGTLLVGAQAACTIERVTTVPSQTSEEPDSGGDSGSDDDGWRSDEGGKSDGYHASANGTHASTTIDHTVSSNPNRLLKVDVISGMIAHVSGVSSNVDGALVSRAVASTGTVGVRSFTLVNPTEGRHTLTVGFSGGDASTTIIVTEYRGVHQSTPIRGTPVAADGNGTTSRVTAQTAAGDLVVDALFSFQDATVGADQTLLGNTFVSPSYHGHTSEQAGKDGGEMSYTLAERTSWAMIAYSLIPAGAR
jgi:hypothetical protein